MNTPQLTQTEIAAIVIGVAALIIIALIVWAFNRRRTAKLRAQFGPEYDRTVAVAGSRTTAENRLAARSERVHKLVIRALNPGERARYVEEWTRVQARFVDAPAGAVTEADQLLGDVMAACGYPMGDFEQRAADISVDHPVVTQNYRAAHEIALRKASGRVTTEELRRAMIHYRALFEELVNAPVVAETRPVQVEGRPVQVVEERVETTEYTPRRRAS